MAAEFYVGSLASGSGTGSVTVTGIPFQPKAVIFFSTIPTAMDAWHDAANVTVGFADDALNQACYGNHFDDNAASSNGARSKRLGECLSIYNGSAHQVIADLTAVTSDGFTVNFSTNSIGVRYYNYIAIGGTGVSVKAGEFNATPSSPGNVATTGIGFQPDIVFFGGQPFASAGDQAAGTQPMTGPMFGWYASGGQGVAASNQRNNNVSAVTAAFRYQSTSNCIARCGDAVGNPIQALASGVSLDADGWTLNWSATPGANFRIPFLAIQGVTPVSGSLDQPTGTGGQSVSVGVAPLLGLFISSHQTVLDTQAEDAAHMLMGAEDGTREQGMVWGSEDNVNPSRNAELISTSQAISLLATSGGVAATGSSTTAAAQASVTFGALSLELNWNTVDATVRKVIYLALAAGAGAGGPTVGWAAWGGAAGAASFG